MTLDPLAPESGYTTAYDHRSLGELHAAVYNPRQMGAQEREKLIRSLLTFGFVEPAVVRAEDGLVIGGHQRLDCWREALTRSGLTPEEANAQLVPVMVISGLSDERAKLLNLALNRISGDWDHGKLAELLGSLTATLQPPELDLSGFQAPEIADYTAMLGNLPALGATAGAGGGAAPAGGGGGGGGSDSPPAGDFVIPGAAATADDALALAASRLVVEFASAAEAEEARALLTRFGMTGDGDAPQALLTALRAAVATLPEAPASKPRGKARAPRTPAEST